MFTSNCSFASYSVAACTCVSGPYRPTDATGPRQWCYWAPAEMGRVPETWGTNGQSGKLSPLHKNSVKEQVQNSTHEENFLLKIQRGANWLLKVAILIRLFNQGSDLEQSFGVPFLSSDFDLAFLALVLSLVLDLDFVALVLGPWPWLGQLACITCFTLWRLLGPHIQRFGPSHKLAQTHLFALQPKCNCQIFFVMLHIFETSRLTRTKKEDQDIFVVARLAICIHGMVGWTSWWSKFR